MIWSRAPGFFSSLLKLILIGEHFADRIGVAGGERHDGGVDDALVFAGELFLDQRREFFDVEMENFRDQAEHENVFALVLGRAAERFNGQAGDGDADVNETFVIEVRLDVVGIVKEDAAFFQEIDVVLVTVLIKRDEKIGFVTGGKHFAGAHADLENGWTAGNGGGNRHVSHDVLVAAAGEAREKGAGGLNAVLGIAGETDDGVVDVFGAEIGSVRRWGNRGR